MDVTSTRHGRILVPVDGSAYADSAIPYAAKLAGGEHSLILLRVLPNLMPYPVLWRPIGETPGEASRRFEGAALRWIEKKAESCTQAFEVPVEAVVAVGEPGAAILRHARERDASLIVMASAGLGALDPLAFGSVADRVVRQATVPVFVVQPEAGLTGAPAIRRLVVPLDGSRRAAAVLPVAADLGHRLGVPIALVTVIDPTRAAPASLAYEAVMVGGFPGEVLAGLQGEAQRVLDDAVAELKGKSGNPARFVKYGSVASCVAALCAPGDVLVMATHGRGQESWPLGGVAGMLLRAAPVPVLLVRTAPPRELALGQVYERAGLPSATADPTLSRR